MLWSTIISIDAHYPEGLSYELLVSGNLSAQQIMDTKLFFYKSIVYTVYLEEIRHGRVAGESEKEEVLYSLDEHLSSKNSTCINLYKWIIYFCPFLAHRFGSRFMNNVKRAYLTQKRKHSLVKYIDGALDMTICSKKNRDTYENPSTDRITVNHLMDSIKELKTILQNQTVVKIDYSSFRNSELRNIVYSAFSRLSVLCNNVRELDRDQLIILSQYLNVVNGLLSS